MHSANNLDHNQNFINLTKLQRKAWNGPEASAKKIDRKCDILNRAYLAFFSMLISIIITLLVLLIHYKSQFNLAKTLSSSLNSSTLTVVNGLNQTTSKLCISKECIQSSAYLLERIDFSVNPCDDFYAFACGKFVKSKTVPDDHISRNILQEIQDEIYIEMKNYLEARIVGEEDELGEETRGRMNGKVSGDKDDRNGKSDKEKNETKPLDESLTDLQLNEKRLIDKQLSDKLSSDEQLSKQLDDQLKLNSRLLELNEINGSREAGLSIEDLDQDKLTAKLVGSVQLDKRTSSKRKSPSEPPELNSVRKVKMFYRSCMNETTVNDEPTSVNVILNLIYEYGGEWSLLSRTSQPNETFKQVLSIQSPTYRFDSKKPIKHKLETRIFSVFLHQIQPIFHFYVAPEEFKRNSKDYAIHLYSGSTILESSYFINSTASNSTPASQPTDYREAYMGLQLEILMRLAQIKGRSVNASQAMAEIEKVVNFEADLANITKLFSENSTQNGDIITDMLSVNASNLQPTEPNLNSNLNGNLQSSAAIKTNYSSDSSPQPLNQARSKTAYIRLNLTVLEEKYNFINWRFLFGLMESSAQRKKGDKKLAINELLLESTDYLEQIELLFKRHDLITIDNYLCWATIARFLPYLGSNFRRTFTEFRRKIPDPPAPTDLQQIESAASFFSHHNLASLLSAADDRPDDSYRLLEQYKRRKNSASTAGRMFLSRWKECVHLTSEGLKKPIAILYLQEKKQYVESIATKVSEMVDNIKEAFYKIVDQQDWLLSDEIKQLVKKRAESIKSKIGFPEYLMDLKAADEQFGDVEIHLGDVFVANIIKMVRHEIKGELKLLNSKIDPDKDWMIDTLVPNAYYDALNHFIILPVAILREPLISLKRPKYLDYATLGVVIGHEVAHAFDTGTRKEINNAMSGTGVPANKSLPDENTSWWPQQLNTEYEKKSQCFVKQFDGYLVDEINENLNGNLTLEENICDFSGFQQAYLAYQHNKDEDDDVLLPGLTELSPEKLFFVQYAQVWCEISGKEGYRKALLDSHAPGRFRANGVVSNSRQYSEVFNCKPNDKMNQANKCDLWAY